MSTAVLASPVPLFSDRLFSLFEKIDYRVAVSDEDRDEVFRLRYDAYEREKAILPSFSRRLSDRYDDLDNTIIVSLRLDNEIAATIRISVATSDFPQCPAMEAFSDAVMPKLEAGKIVIDPTRHATSDYFSRAYPGLLPYLTTRVAWMAGDYFNADYILASVRSEHQAFYRRVFGCRVVCDPRDYPPLIKPLSLMTLDYKAEKDTVQRRYPSFRSTQFERRMMFEAPKAGLTADIADKSQSAPLAMRV